jgi:hypothetical protein
VNQIRNRYLEYLMIFPSSFIPNDRYHRIRKVCLLLVTHCLYIRLGLDVLIYLIQTSLLVIGLLSIVTLITTSILISPAFALKRFFNCMTNIANKTGKLTIDDVNLCYDKKFTGGSKQKTGSTLTSRSQP